MAANVSVVVEGVLRVDDTIELASHPPLPPGPVRVRLEQMAAVRRSVALLPDPPWPDESISAPFDLTVAGRPVRVVARKISVLLPEPFEFTEKDLRP